MGTIDMTRPEYAFSAYRLADPNDESTVPTTYSIRRAPTLAEGRAALESALADGDVGILREWPGWEVLRLRREGDRYRELNSVTRRVNAEADRRLREVLAEELSGP